MKIENNMLKDFEDNPTYSDEQRQLYKYRLETL